MPYRDKTRNNQWRAKVTRNGKAKTQLFKTKTEAQKWEADQKALPLAQFVDETPTGYSLAIWAEKYLDHSKLKHSQKAYKEKVLAFRLLFISISETIGPSSLHPGAILKHFDKQAKARSGHAANKDRKNLIAAWNWARKYLPGWPRDNPFADTERQIEERHPRYVPPVEDFWAVYDIAQGQDKVMLLTYLHTAARRTELFQLKWEDVDFNGKRIRLWTSKRKGGKEFDWVPMTRECQEALAQWNQCRTFKDSEHVFLCEDRTPFCTEYYGKPFLKRQHWLSSLCEKAKVKPFGIHAIRHLSASILDDRNYPITVIQAILRHKSANTTAKYLHRLRGIRTALDDAFTREPAPAAPPARRERPILRVVNST